MGTTPGESSRSGFHSKHSAFSVYLKDSRLNPSDLYIPDGSGETITQRAGNHYSYLPCFDSDLFMIDHHTGDLYLYDRDNKGIELLAIQATNLLILTDRAKMMALMCVNL